MIYNLIFSWNYSVYRKQLHLRSQLKRIASFPSAFFLFIFVICFHFVETNTLKKKQQPKQQQQHQKSKNRFE